MRSTPRGRVATRASGAASENGPSARVAAAEACTPEPRWPIGSVPLSLAASGRGLRRARRREAYPGSGARGPPGRAPREPPGASPQGKDHDRATLRTSGWTERTADPRDGRHDLAGSEAAARAAQSSGPPGGHGHGSGATSFGELDDELREPLDTRVAVEKAVVAVEGPATHRLELLP